MLYFVFSGPVFCVALDPKEGKLAVSGGEDDRAFIWQTLNGNTLLECTGRENFLFQCYTTVVPKSVDYSKFT